MWKMNLHLQYNGKRNALRLVLKLANQKDAYKGKCNLDADTLVIKGIKYMVNNISELQEDISAMKATQKMNEKTLCYFGELSPFSNLHPCISNSKILTTILQNNIYSMQRLRCSEIRQQLVQF